MQRNTASAKTAARTRDRGEALRRDAEALHAAVSELVRIYQFRDRDRICCHDISVTQCYALETLAEKGPMRSQALAESLRLDKSTVTRVVDALARKGYVERLRDALDGRALSLRITPSGRALCDRINRELVVQQAELLADLDPEIRAGVADVVRRLATAAQRRFAACASVGGCDAAACASPSAG